MSMTAKDVAALLDRYTDASFKGLCLPPLSNDQLGALLRYATRPAATDGSALADDHSECASPARVIDLSMRLDWATKGAEKLREENRGLREQIAALTTQKAAGASDAGMREAIEETLNFLAKRPSLRKHITAEMHGSDFDTIVDVIMEGLPKAALTAVKAPADEAVCDVCGLPPTVLLQADYLGSDPCPKCHGNKPKPKPKAPAPEAVCEVCSGEGWIPGEGFEAGHNCDGSDESCAANCPIPVRVQIQEPCPACAADKEK